MAAQTLSPGGFSITGGDVDSDVGVSVGVGTGDCVGSLVSVMEGVTGGMFVAARVTVMGMDVEVEVMDDVTGTVVSVE